MLGLLGAAVEYAHAQGAAVMEGYPVEPGARLYAYMGAPATFAQAGFADVTLAGQERRVMRYVIAGEDRPPTAPAPPGPDVQ